MTSLTLSDIRFAFFDEQLPELFLHLATVVKSTPKD